MEIAGYDGLHSLLPVQVSEACYMERGLDFFVYPLGDVAWPPGAESTFDPEDPTLNTIQGISIPRICAVNAPSPRTLASVLLKGWRVSEHRVAKMSVAALLSALPSDRPFLRDGAWLR